MGACTMPGDFFIVQEFLTGGDVEKALRDRDRAIPLYVRMRWAKDASLGMNWLHQSNPVFIHRDLKSSNLLIDENGRVKVCDFGLSEVKMTGQMLQDTDSAKGTPLWMAPEVMMFQRFNEKADVYSFGIILWELLTREVPFSHHRSYEKFKRAVCFTHERPPIPLESDETLQNLITRCWAPNPELRPAFTEIIADLDIILINVAISDPVGRRFWREYFPNEEGDEIDYDTFENNFLNFLRVPTDINPDVLDKNKRCLAELIKTESKSSTHRTHIVNIIKFGKILKWFGPIQDPETNTTGETVLDKIRQTLEKTWFHGDITTKEATALLSDKPGGTFLIRFSESVDGFYTISKISSTRKVTHQRVNHEPGSPYIIDNHEYASLEELVDQRGFTSPCENSKYASIFNAEVNLSQYINV